MSTLIAINNYYYDRGGSEAIFFAHNRMFEELGWNVVPFSMQHSGNHATPWSKYFIDDLEMHGDYSLTQKLVRLPKVIYSFEARRRLGELLGRVRPDIAHAHNIYHHISPSILGLLKGRGIPTVLTLHDLKIACPAYNMLAPDGICERCKGGKVYNVVRNRCIGGSAAMSLVVMMEAVVHKLLGSYRRHVDCFVVPSRFYIDKFSEWGMPASLFRHVPNFVDVPRYEPRYEPGDAFLYFGRVIRQKGVATLIRAVAGARKKLLIAGTGPELEEMRALAAGLNADVTFLGHLGGQQLRDVIGSCRAVVLPSEWYENAPVSLLEAYALGKPVIGARIGGIPELIRENETGVCFESGNVSSLQRALEDFDSRPGAQIQAMGRAGRRWVAEEFTVAMYRQRIMAVYRDLGVHVTTASPLPLSASS
ncbi:MAG TPA: glycosyltransferase family 4 protein [Steroidobacteraceae bacterium]|nr:glycosyltransferase family 4 protein [Steroidobacteraceae bacterium]